MGRVFDSVYAYMCDTIHRHTKQNIVQHHYVRTTLGDRIRACLGCPAEMECVIRLLWDCMYDVEKTAMEWRLENCDKVNKHLNTSPLDWLNFEVRFHKQSLNQLHYLLTPTHT